MISSLPIRAGRAVFFHMLLAFLLLACASGPKNNDEVFFDASTVKLIQLDIEPIDQQALGISASRQEMTEQVKNNLAGWGYPIEINDGKAYTHTLKVKVDPVEHDAPTPTGFSFSSGNSDPRSREFQKADVLPVSCELTSIAHPRQSRLLSMDFSVNSIPWADKQSRYSISSGKLLDHISTVCFNLLNDVKWPDKKQSLVVPVIKPSWIPEIRIETIEEPAKVKELEPAGEASKTSHSSGKESRKQVIINNEGAPVIIKFGYDRM
jgi:hypothetical protein